MKKLINLIFTEKHEQQEQQPQWTFEHNGWEASAKHYNAQHGLRRNKV